jgi:coenzyme F420-0:L-glutamate ligase/coenzyme F420-1:gamma-L-glutamate ligase
MSIPGLPLIKPGDDLPKLIVDCLQATALTLQPNDVLVITSKIVSKSEGRYLDLRTISPSENAHEVAKVTGKDPRLIEVILAESTQISRMAPNVIVTRHRLGFVSANSGIDHSNVGPDGEDWVLLLPIDPDESARRIREAIRQATGVAIGIIISDTHGRPHRLGNIGIAIGVAGIPALLDLRGRPDLFGRVLQGTDIGLADEIASAAAQWSSRRGIARDPCARVAIAIHCPHRWTRHRFDPSIEHGFVSIVLVGLCVVDRTSGFVGQRQKLLGTYAYSLTVGMGNFIAGECDCSYDKSRTQCCICA